MTPPEPENTFPRITRIDADDWNLSASIREIRGKGLKQLGGPSGPALPYFPRTHEKISGATIVASLSTMNFGVFAPSLPQVIFSFGTAPE